MSQPSKSSSIVRSIFSVTSLKATSSHIAAAAQNHAKALCKLGDFYKEGRGFPIKCPLESALWYQKAAVQGHAQAQYNLGVFFAQGREVDAKKWYQKAAAQGHAEAQNQLARLEAPLFKDSEVKLQICQAEQLRIAKKFKQAGVDPAIIATATGLTLEQIATLSSS